MLINQQPEINILHFICLHWNSLITLKKLFKRSKFTSRNFNQKIIFLLYLIQLFCDYRKSIIEESPASPTASDSCAVEFGNSDVDLRQLPFQFPIAAATEIDASLDSHPPMKYHMSPTQVSVPDYSKIPPTVDKINIFYVKLNNLIKLTYFM